MKAMILSAGLGKRMRPLTAETPKPLLKVAGRYLIEYHLERLAKSGIKHVVINTHWLAEQLPAALGTGERWGLEIDYAFEPELLETAGGIQAVLPLLCDGDECDDKKSAGGAAPFLVINGDVYTELDLSSWLANAPELGPQCLAYLAMVENPDHHPHGDFCFQGDSGSDAAVLSLPLGRIPAFTYSGIALFHPQFFQGLPAGSSPLAPLLKNHIEHQRVRGRKITEYWLDVGTPERLAILNARLGG